MVMNSFDKQTMRQWLWDMDRVKAENKRFEELLTKWKDKRIEVLIKENRELRKENKELKKEKWEVRQRFIKLQEAQAKLIRVAENKELKEEIKKRKMIADENWEHYDMMKDEYEKLEKENKELKKKLDILYHHV